MRIAQVAPLVESVPPRLYGGTERVIAALTHELIALGHEVTLYATADSATPARLVSVTPTGTWSSDVPLNETAYHTVALARVVREAEEYDIVHSHLDFLGFPFGRFSRRPWVHTLHGRLDTPELQAVFTEFREAPVVSISNSQRSPLPQANWLATVYNGLPVENVPVGAGLGGYLAFLGRISPEKGVADAIDIAIQADIPLKIAARMPLDGVDNAWVRADWAYYREYVKPRLDHPLIEFVGEVDDEGKHQLLGGALALLNPINWPEPFGLVMVEALACGTPVIARDRASAPEIVQHGVTGFLAASPEAMAAYCRAAEDLDRRACRRSVEERFSARAMALGYLRVYERLISQAQARDNGTVERGSLLSSVRAAPDLGPAAA